MKIINQLMTIPPLLIFSLILSCAGSDQSSSEEPELTRKSFKAAISSITSSDSILILCRDWAERTNNIDLLRDIQDQWMDLDKDAARQYYEKHYRDNPESAKYTYLCGRLLSDRIKRIEMGRKAIDLDPEWSYGYRLVLYSYYTHLFLGQGNQQTIDSLKVTFNRDEQLFHHFDALYDDRWFNGKMMFYYYCHKGEYRSAEGELAKAKEWNWKWEEEAEQLLRSVKDHKQESDPIQAD